MRYEIPIIHYGDTAKSKAMASDVIPAKGPDQWIVIDVGNDKTGDDEAAWKHVCALVLPNDPKQRPIAGKSYMRKSRISKQMIASAIPHEYKVGDPVILHTPYGHVGEEKKYGKISEVLGGNHTRYSVEIPGYGATKYVDFTTAEIPPDYRELVKQRSVKRAGR